MFSRFKHELKSPYSLYCMGEARNRGSSIVSRSYRPTLYVGEGIPARCVTPALGGSPPPRFRPRGISMGPDYPNALRCAHTPVPRQNHMQRPPSAWDLSCEMDLQFSIYRPAKSQRKSWPTADEACSFDTGHGSAREQILRTSGIWIVRSLRYTPRPEPRSRGGKKAIPSMYGLAVYKTFLRCTD